MSDLNQMGKKSFCALKLLLEIKFRIRVLIFFIGNLLWGKKRNEIFTQQEKEGLENIPIFLISFNRLSYLKRMIEQLENLGKQNIIVIDNNSSYPPLLKYYDEIPYEVIRLKENYGHKVFWENPVFDRYRDKFYVVSDPDIEVLKECPKDFMEYFFYYLKKYPFVRKIGFSLKIDDLPLDNKLTAEVINWEKRFYLMKIKKSNLYYAEIDTTFALYIPDKLVRKQAFLSAFRTGYPYQARHIPWYKNVENVTEEDIYYSEHKTNGWWDNADGEVTPD